MRMGMCSEILGLVLEGWDGDGGVGVLWDGEYCFEMGDILVGGLVV